jgi:hypothetical protein
MRKWMERNEGGEVVRRRIERKEGTTSLPSSSPSYSLPLSLLHLNPPPHYFSSLIPLHPLPHYISPSFLSVIITTSLPPSSSLLISLLALLFLLPLPRKEGERQ